MFNNNKYLVTKFVKVSKQKLVFTFLNKLLKKIDHAVKEEVVLENLYFQW